MKTKEKPILTFQVISDTEVIAAAPRMTAISNLTQRFRLLNARRPKAKLYLYAATF